MTRVHELRRSLRTALRSRRGLVGTFVKIADVDVIDLVAAAGFDFVVVDLEHSTLATSQALALVGRADAIGLPALVRVPAVDAAVVNRLLEAGAVGIQLSMLRTGAQRRQLAAATRFAPDGERSVSLSNHAAGYGAVPLARFHQAEAQDPPLLVGQIETAVDQPWPDVVGGLDVVFVGSTDLAVSIGAAAGEARLLTAVAEIRDAASAAGAAFGGWSATLESLAANGLDEAGYLLVGSDLQILASGLRAAAERQEEEACD
jgi:4-hydroxy-2-oxoheptanedioate aldolase